MLLQSLLLCTNKKQSNTCLPPSDFSILNIIILAEQTKLQNYDPLFIEDICLCQTALYVGEKLVADEPLLLTDIKLYYCKCYTAQSQSQATNASLSPNVSTTWIKLELNKIFKDQWSLSTLTKDGKQVNTHSTLIVRKGINLKNVVHKYLVKCNQYIDAEADYENRIEHHKQELERLRILKTNTIAIKLDQHLQYVSHYIRYRLRDQVNRFINNFKHKEMERCSVE